MRRTVPVGAIAALVAAQAHLVDRSGVGVRIVSAERDETAAAATFLDVDRRRTVAAFALDLVLQRRRPISVLLNSAIDLWRGTRRRPWSRRNRFPTGADGAPFFTP